MRVTSILSLALAIVFRACAIDTTPTPAFCSSHDQCSSEMPFCYDGGCQPCDECHYCHDGVDGTCGPCGDGYPTQESGDCSTSYTSTTTSCDCSCHVDNIYEYVPDERNDPVNDCWILDIGYDKPCCTFSSTGGECCSCLEAHDSTGCASDSDCEASVCADDAFCCDSQWDSTCVDHYASPICGIASYSSTTAPDPLLSSLRSMFDEFECFGGKKKNYYADAPYAEITNLPQVRLMMCGYESQCALQFAAYLFMSEKLGMNVTFYPTLDYDNIWSGEHWDDWVHELAYPRKYFEWLADDEGDLQFEIWETQMYRTDGSGQETFNGATEFFNEGKVDNGGSVGATGEEGLWVPSYMFDDNPDFVIPSSLRDNAEYREQLINASMATYEGASVDATDFVALYADSADFDSPTYTKPTVWTSHPSYDGSEYSHDLVSTAPNDLDMNFVATGSESSLAAMVTELYAARQPFIAYMYTLDVNFGREDAATGELQQFEKLAYPSYTEQGFEDGTCQFPVAPISKMANPLLAERFPEAYEFFQLFEMSTPQINLLTSKYLTINDDTANFGEMLSTEKWLHAACNWMKDEESTSTWNTGAWEVPLTPRFDCGGGCGINGIGGDCDIQSGECECWMPELFSDTHCTESCPGLVGPSLDQNGEWEFNFCSGHGECNVVSRECSCDESWEGDDCSITLSTAAPSNPTHPAYCNHAVIDGQIGVVPADVCFKDGDDSRMLKCRGGKGYLLSFISNNDCDEEHVNVFEFALDEMPFETEVICDADPCHIAVVEIYDDEDSSDSSDSSEASHSSDWGGVSTFATTASSCDYSNPSIATFIVGACDSGLIITCTGTHDAMVSIFMNAACNGTAMATTSVSNFLDDECASMVACNVEAGVDYDAASPCVMFGPLLIAFAALLLNT